MLKLVPSKHQHKKSLHVTNFHSKPSIRASNAAADDELELPEFTFVELTSGLLLLFCDLLLELSEDDEDEEDESLDEDDDDLE